jgi:hypothetical protein
LTFLHLVNGETTAHGLKAAGIEGDKHACDDLFLYGPLRGGLHDEDSWRERAEYLEAWAGLPAQHYLRRVIEREEVLSCVDDCDEVVVWSEEDIWCATAFWWLLDRLSSVKASVSLVLPPRVRLGEAPAHRLRAFLDDRLPVTPARFDDAARLWNAYCSDSPDGLRRLQADGLALPWAAEAIGLHFQRFPAERDLLTLVERTVLRFLEGGPLPFGALFRFFGDDPQAGALGLGNHWFAAELRDMERYGLVAIQGAGPSNFEGLEGWMLRVTLTGREALSGGAQNIPFQRWLGGVWQDGRRPTDPPL